MVASYYKAANICIVFAQKLETEKNSFGKVPVFFFKQIVIEL